MTQESPEELIKKIAEVLELDDEWLSSNSVLEAVCNLKKERDDLLASVKRQRSHFDYYIPGLG